MNKMKIGRWVMPKKSPKDIRLSIGHEELRKQIYNKFSTCSASIGTATDTAIYCWLDADGFKIPELIAVGKSGYCLTKYIKLPKRLKLFTLPLEPGKKPSQRTDPLSYCLHFENIVLCEATFMGCDTAVVMHHELLPDGKPVLTALYILLTDDLIKLSDLQSRYNLGPIKQNKRKKAA